MSREDDTTSLWSVYRAFFTVAKDDALAYPITFAFQQLSGMVLVIPFFFISQFLVEGDNYFEFVVVGLIVTHFLHAGLLDLGESLQTLISRGTFEFVLTQPIRWRQVPFVLVTWPLLVRTCLAVVLLATSLTLGADFEVTRPALLAGILLCAIAATFAIGLLGLALRVQSKRSDPATTLYMFGLWIFGGIYFPVTSLPGVLQPISLLFPHSFAVDAIRSLVVESTQPALYAAETSLAILAAYAAVALPLAMFALNRSFAVGRRTGGLTAY